MCVRVCVCVAKPVAVELRCHATVLILKKCEKVLQYCKSFSHFLAKDEPHCEKISLPGFPTRSDTHQAVQLQKMARSLKFRI